MKKLLIPLLLLITCVSCKISNEEGTHLFILSGQSNMQRLQPQETFVPMVEKSFGSGHVTVVKDAKGGQPIRRWYKNWKPKNDTVVEFQADLYDSLWGKIIRQKGKIKFKTVTFIWMQGERDAREVHGEVYEESLLGLYQQLSDDLERTDINFIIGRLSDFDMDNDKYPHWTMIRNIQEKVAASNPRFALVNTDDLNDGLNNKGVKIKDDLHMSVQGYRTMGERFAEKAIELINK